MRPSASPAPLKAPASASSSLLSWLALLISLAVLNGSLYLNLGMGLRSCSLCLVQQGFMMGVVAILAIGLVSGVFRAGSLSLLALPLTLGGTILAGVQVVMEVFGVLECPAGIMDVGTVPEQSLAAQALLLVVLLADVLRQQTPVFATVGSVVLGVALAFFTVKTAPPAPTAAGSETPVEQQGCRQPYRERM